MGESTIVDLIGAHTIKLPFKYFVYTSRVVLISTLEDNFLFAICSIQWKYMQLIKNAKQSTRLWMLSPK